MPHHLHPGTPMAAAVPVIDFQAIHRAEIMIARRRTRPTRIRRLRRR